MSTKHHEIRWTGVASDIYHYCESLAAGKETKKISVGLCGAVKRFLRLALAGMGDAEALHETGNPEMAIRCYGIAHRALMATGIVTSGRLNEMKQVLAEFKALAYKLDTDEAKNDRVGLQKMAKFFERIYQVGREQRYVEYVHGIPEEDNDE